MEDSFFRKDEEPIKEENIPALEKEPMENNGQGSEKDRAMIAAILAYIPFLCLIPLLQMRDNEDARFHSRQGLILFIIEIFAGFFLIPGVSSTIWKMVIIAALGASLAGIVFGIQGKRYSLPIISDIARKINI